MIIIDSSFWIEWFQTKTDPRPIIRPWVLHRSCFTCGIIRIEVIRGVIHEAQKVKIEGLFNTLEDIPLSQELLHSAAQLAWELDRAGKVVPLSDIIIAECARRSNSTVVTHDDHFGTIQGHFGSNHGMRVRKTMPVKFD